MAFPLDSAHLISHLRSSYLVSFDGDTDIRSMLGPNDDDPDGEIYKDIFDKLTISTSPPISLIIEDKFDNRIARSKSTKRRSRIRKRKSRIDKHPSIVEEKEDSHDETLKDNIQNDREDEENDEDKIEDDKPKELKYSQTINPRKVKNNIIRLFQKEHDGIDSDGSDESVKTTKLADIEHNDVITDDENDLLITDEELDSDTTQKLPHDSPNEIVTLDSNAVSLDSEKSFDPDMTLDSKESLGFSDEDDDEDYDYEDDEFEEDLSSSDSAFTDIEADSILDTSLLLDDSFDTADYSYGKHNDKYRKKKPRVNSFGLNNSKGSSTFPNTAPTKEKLHPSSSSSSLKVLKKPVLEFDKITPVKESIGASNLSSLLQSRNKSVNTNPLYYYSFVESNSSVKINIFVPPKTISTINELEINPNSSVSDCIGYILLKLSALPEFKDEDEFEFLDPNYWRLELVDEDGENYGSFGILDRTRLFSSYNNPKEIAICKVEDEKEYKKNQTQTPLASEFRQNLLAYRRKRLLADEFSQTSDEQVTEPAPQLIQLFIKSPNGQRTAVEFDSKCTVKEVLYDFCSQLNLNPTNYKIRLVMPDMKTHLNDDTDDILTLKENSDLINDTRSNKRILDNEELIKDVESSFFELVPNKGGPIFSLLSPHEGLNELDNTISPVNIDLITPPKMHNELSTIDSVVKAKKPQESKKPEKSGTSKAAVDSSGYFDELIGLNGNLFGNNARYFTWKVWRKKTTILNKLEKSLIIDGDYIRLQPPEDKAYLKNPDDNPFLQGQSQSQSHHHRHLYQYNYSNYYNSSMMKTSSFHISQIVKLKQYKNSKNPNHFKIVIQKPGKDSTNIKKKYDLEAVDETECQEIFDKIKWVLNLYNSEMTHMKI
ncbi:hypothetical protein CLIB1444_02S08878 [[Candida] jaroonii]|uniref:Uncharacterized protein n=1 Tax=[Candida] jaroonii TaxID=467808 RepID=A0ACA9Y3F0_9ASCO|nr:hypothetical protein CLIB1444_02S08878 [[Candida] jaroonii]